MCVAQLVNRLKSLMIQKEMEVVTLDDIPRDKEFVRQSGGAHFAKPRIYSLYRKIYLAKEEAVEEHILLCAKGTSLCYLCRYQRTKWLRKSRSDENVLPQLPDICQTRRRSSRKRWYDNALGFIANAKKSICICR